MTASLKFSVTFRFAQADVLNKGLIEAKTHVMPFLRSVYFMEMNDKGTVQRVKRQEVCGLWRTTSVVSFASHIIAREYSTRNQFRNINNQAILGFRFKP